MRGRAPWGAAVAQATAFTLVELLVVVALIAALLAILLPSLGAARAQGKRAACGANLHGLAQAWHTYLDENRGAFYQGESMHYNWGGGQGQSPIIPPSQLPPIHKPLNPQVGLHTLASLDDARAFRCPADSGSDIAAPTFYDAYGTSYLANQMLVSPFWMRVDANDPAAQALAEARARARGLNASRVSVPTSEVLLAGDGGWLFAIDFVPKAPVDWHARPATHNIAFLDGHAGFTRIRRAIYVDAPAYNVIPFRDEAARIAALQQERP